MSFKRAFTAEWSQTIELGEELATRQGMTTGMGLDAGVKFESVAEETLKTTYGITETRRVTRSDEVSFDVPAGVRRQVRLIHNRTWQHGVVRVDGAGAEIEVPFRVLTNVEVDYDFDDFDD